MALKARTVPNRRSFFTIRTSRELVRTCAAKIIRAARFDAGRVSQVCSAFPPNVAVTSRVQEITGEFLGPVKDHRNSVRFPAHDFDEEVRWTKIESWRAFGPH